MITTLALLLAVNTLPTYLWFDLVRYEEGRWRYIDAFETLEDCQEARQQYEQDAPGNYYCFPTKVMRG